MRRSPACLLVLVVAAVTACGSPVTPGSDASIAPGDASVAAAPDLSPALPSYTVHFGPVDVAPGYENTQCIIKRLGNPTPIHVGSIHDRLGDASHHMIVYRVADTMEQPAPFDCTPFKDTLDPTKGSPIIVSQKRDDLLTLPPGVAFNLDANQMVRVEMHYINATTAKVTLDSSATFTTIDEAAYKDEAGFLFIGSPDIQIPAMSKLTLGPDYFVLPPQYAQAKFFAITGHEHRLGTGVTVSTAASATDPGTSVYDVPGWTWSEPATVIQDPPFTVPAGGGFKFTCQWNNTTGDGVQFGESATNEMCFFWAYYYPNQGAKVCVHTKQGGGLDFCCPGSQFCKFIP